MKKFVFNPRELLYRKRHLNEVAHTTLNPEGPGFVQIHLVPPRFDRKGQPSLAFLNGSYIVPLMPSAAILLNEFIKEVNAYAGHPMSPAQLDEAVRRTMVSMRKLFPRTKVEQFKSDLMTMIDVFCKIAYGQKPEVEIGYMSIGEYAPHMRAPHRMDLMVSSMMKYGKWNCNQKCAICYACNEPLAAVPEIGTNKWCEILDKCREVGIPQVTFTGGEPTMRDDLVELVEHARWFVTRLNTNGIRMTPQLCHQLYDASLDNVQFTLYATDAKVHQHLVRTGNYEQTIAGIKNALGVGLSTSINTPLCATNWMYYLDTLKAVHEWGVRYVTCSGIIPTGNGSDPAAQTVTPIEKSELLKVLRAAAEYCAKLEMEITFTSPGQLSEEELHSVGLTTPTCGACLSNMAITPNGQVIPCQSWLHEGAQLGDFLTTPWEQIWDSPRCKAQREFASRCTGTCALAGK